MDEHTIIIISKQIQGEILHNGFLHCRVQFPNLNRGRLCDFMWSINLHIILFNIITFILYFYSVIEIKFIYSENATKFCEIFTLLLSYVVPVKSKVKILENFVAFSEYMNFKSNGEIILWRIRIARKWEKTFHSTSICARLLI